jgi:hypothetical protein
MRFAVNRCVLKLNYFMFDKKNISSKQPQFFLSISYAD